MKIKGYLFVLIGLFIGVQSIAQQKITWSNLAEVEFKDSFSEELGATFPQPFFKPSVMALEGQEILIKGYFIPIDPANEDYFLSANPFSMCFFCGNAGPESAMALDVSEAIQGYYTDQILTFKGNLTLNSDDPLQPIYILRNATLVE